MDSTRWGSCAWHADRQRPIRRQATDRPVKEARSDLDRPISHPEPYLRSATQLLHLLSIIHSFIPQPTPPHSFPIHPSMRRCPPPTAGDRGTVPPPLGRSRPGAPPPGQAAHGRGRAPATPALVVPPDRSPTPVHLVAGEDATTAGMHGSKKRRLGTRPSSSSSSTSCTTTTRGSSLLFTRNEFRLQANSQAVPSIHPHTYLPT